MNRSFRVLPRKAGRLLAAALVAAGIGGHATAQQAASDAEETSTTTKLASSGWTVSCRPAPRAKVLFCEASQTIAVSQSRDTLLAIYVSPTQQDGEDAGFALRFQLPHGLDVPAGIFFRVDQGPELSPTIQTSNQSGLFARAELTDTLLAAMKKGAGMTVSVTAVNGNKLSIPVTLNGFSAVYAKLR